MSNSLSIATNVGALTVEEPVGVVAWRDHVACAGHTGADRPELVSAGMAPAERVLPDAEGVRAEVQGVAAVRGRA